ncbi:unnamed protein product [Spirodela intermedia]|uniref:Protein kinase domain-containing protein n=1 Tax=Spirodela intermedia TaxID=51605 RepID=A0A7I8JGT8_SPIIN|nr:unnamed protein product [Spirodela intermedia]CAA6668612.1 unnamed protein product [Spirodela intermedia]
MAAIVGILMGMPLLGLLTHFRRRSFYVVLVVKFYPSDGKLRYVGGQTRMIRINKDISWQEFVQKISVIYTQAHTIKYQLPGEDLDALVSVSCDEDLQNMMEEYSVLDGGEGSQKLRIFLFSPGDFDDSQFGLGSMEGDSEIQYVVAVNGMDLGSGKISSCHDPLSMSTNKLDLLNLNSNDDKATKRSDLELFGLVVLPWSIHSLHNLLCLSQRVCQMTARIREFVLRKEIFNASQLDFDGDIHGPSGNVSDAVSLSHIYMPTQAISHHNADKGDGKIKNEDLEELRELGSGTFGTVYHGKWRGTDVAIKRIKKSCFTGRSSEQERLTVEFWREAEILSKLHHPNVVAFYGVVEDGPGGTLATVTEFMVNGSLRHVLLRNYRYLDPRKRLIIAMDAAIGMEYLHSKNIVHFDLKCDNLLVNLKDPQRPICKVGDFGLSKIKRNTLVSGGVRGTLPWMAPELLSGSSSKVSEKVDVFSFGIVMWEILTGEEPYANMHYGAIIGGIVSNTLRPPVPASCDPEWRRLMEQCWAPDPVQRPSFTEIAGRLRAMSVALQHKTHNQNEILHALTMLPFQVYTSLYPYIYIHIDHYLCMVSIMMSFIYAFSPGF